MSNLDFLLKCTDICDPNVQAKDDTIIVRGTFYGADDLSWVECEYIFDKQGNYISYKEIDSYR